MIQNIKKAPARWIGKKTHKSDIKSGKLDDLDPKLVVLVLGTHVAGAWTERKKMFHGGSFLKLADDDV